MKDIVTDIQVDSGIFVRRDKQEIFTDVKLLRTKAPATLPDWNSTVTRLVEQENLMLLTNCNPFCHNASLQLLYIHGIVELLITVRSLVSGLATSKMVLVVFQPVPSQPRALKPLTMIEDGDYCLVQTYLVMPVSVLLYDFFEDLDEFWLKTGRDRGGNRMQVESSESRRLNASLELFSEAGKTLLVLQLGLHVHGSFNVTVTDQDGLQSTPPLTVIVQHVNHPPYLQYQLPNITMDEEMTSDLAQSIQRRS